MLLLDRLYLTYLCVNNAFVLLQVPEKGAEQAGLSRPNRSHNSNQLSSFHAKVDILQCGLIISPGKRSVFYHNGIGYKYLKMHRRFYS